MAITRVYRGVKKSMHEAGTGLAPRGHNAMPEELWGDGGKWGDGGTWRKSEVNGVIKHQRDRRSYADSAYVSTTPSFDRAKAYALHAENEGVVYVIGLAALDHHRVRCHRVNEVVLLDVAVPEDDEHALVADPPGPLPSSLVIETIVVRRGPA